MSNSNLNAVAIDVVEQYNQAGKSLVQAYRAGSQRVLRTFNDGYATVVTERLPMVDGEIKSRWNDAQGQFASAVTNGVEQVAAQTEQLIDRFAEGATNGIQQLSSAQPPFGAAVNAQAVEAVNSLNLQAAQLSLQVATQVAEGAKRLADQIGATDVAEAKPARKRAATNE